MSLPYSPAEHFHAVAELLETADEQGVDLGSVSATASGLNVHANLGDDWHAVASWVMSYLGGTWETVHPGSFVAVKSDPSAREGHHSNLGTVGVFLPVAPILGPRRLEHLEGLPGITLPA